MPVTVKVHSRLRPRKQPDWRGVYRSDGSLKLDKTLCVELEEITGIEGAKARSLLKEVRELLSMFPDMERALDRQAPRPAHKLKILMPLLKIPSRRHQEWQVGAQRLAEWPSTLGVGSEW